MTARSGGPRRLNLTFSAADRQIAPPFPVAGRHRRLPSESFIRAPSLGSRLCRDQEMAGPVLTHEEPDKIYFDLDGTLAESKTNLMREFTAAPNSRGIEDLFPKISPSYKKIIGALNQAV